MSYRIKIGFVTDGIATAMPSLPAGILGLKSEWSMNILKIEIIVTLLNRGAGSMI
jgi:hypothetical protein